MSAQIGDNQWFLGTPDYIREQTGHTLEPTLRASYRGQTLVVLAQPTGITALYGLADTLREESPALVSWLKKRGIRTAMLTGDHREAANLIAQEVGIDRVYAGQLPADKLSVVQQAQQHATGKKVVGMVGDGVNDAAVLAAADCAIATQGAAALASAGSDILLLTPRISAIRTAIQTADKTNRIIKQNLIWASSYNLLAIPAAAMGHVPPWAAAIGMSLSSLLVILNALRLKKRRD